MYIHDDVRTLTAGLLRERCGRLPSVIVGSPPCQDASFARSVGNRSGIGGEQTGLFAEYLRLVREVRPVWACAENVLGLDGVGHDEICGELEAEGYRVWTHDLDVEDFGGTNERRRLWVLAVADADQAGLSLAGAVECAKNSERQRAAFGDHEAPRNPWCEGESSALRMAARVPDGVGGKWIAAIGDAVCPQIAEAIGRSMMRLCPTDGATIDLFAGAASGWSLGMERAGYTVIAACEIDPWRRSVIQHRQDGNRCHT